MAEPITLNKLADASIDADTLGEFANEDKMVTSRLGAEYPSAPMASRLTVENGLLGATPFSTYSAMTASALVDGDYAVVTNDANIVENGVYRKEGSEWVSQTYNKSVSAATVFFKTSSSVSISYNTGTKTLSTSGSIVMLTNPDAIKKRIALVIPAFSISITGAEYQVIYIDLNNISATGTIDPNAAIKASGYFTGDDLYQGRPNQVPIFTLMSGIARSVNGFFEGQVEGATRTLAEVDLQNKITNLSALPKTNPLPLFFKAYLSSTVSYNSATRTLSTSNLTVLNLNAGHIAGRRSLLIPAFSVVLTNTDYAVAYIDLSMVSAGTGVVSTDIVKTGSYQGADANAYLSLPHQLPIFTLMSGIARSVNGFFEGQVEGATRNIEERNLYSAIAQLQTDIGNIDSSGSNSESAHTVVSLQSGKLVQSTTDGIVDYYDPAPNSFLGGVTQNPNNVVATLDKKALTNTTPAFIGGKETYVKSPMVIPSDPNILIVIPSFGQSNSVGSEGYEPPVNLTKNPYGDSLMMPSGVGEMDIRLNLPSGTENVGAETALDPATITGFQPLIAKQSTARSNQGATPLEAMGLVLAKNIHESMGVKPKICMFAAGWGGRFQSDLAKGTIPYQNLITALTRIKTLAAAEGLKVYVPFMAVIHGESDSYKPEYVAGIKSWQVDFNADIKSITDQTADIPFLCSQASTFSGGTNTYGVLSPYEASKTGSTHYVAAPYYPYSLAPDNLHLGKSAGFVGEKLAHAASRLSGLFGSKEKGALQPTLVTYNNDKQIDIVFNVPVLPLARDTSDPIVNNPAPTNWGFVIKDGAGDAVPIASITIIGSSVRIITSSIVSSGSQRAVEYALNGFNTTKVTGQQPRGQLRDSEQLTSIIDGQPLYNWCVHFRELF